MLKQGEHPFLALLAVLLQFERPAFCQLPKDYKLWSESRREIEEESLKIAVMKDEIKEGFRLMELELADKFKTLAAELTERIKAIEEKVDGAAEFQSVKNGRCSSWNSVSYTLQCCCRMDS